MFLNSGCALESLGETQNVDYQAKLDREYQNLWGLYLNFKIKKNLLKYF